MIELPQAVANDGAATRDPDQVRAVPAAIVAGLVAACFLFAWSAARPIPGRALALFGAPAGGVARWGGLHLVWQPPPGVVPAEVGARLATHRSGIDVHVQDGALVIDIPRVRAADADEVARLVGADGGLEFREVIEGDALAGLDGMAAGVHVERDTWRADPSSPTYETTAAVGPSRAALDAAVRKAEAWSWRPPAGTELGYEHVAARPGRPARWRALLVGPALLDGRAIANATRGYARYTNRPIVMIELTPDGRARFADVTRRVVGHKLAIVIGDEIESAPVINEPILGGRAQVTLGGTDPAAQERDARALVTALRVRELPRGGHLVANAYVAPADLAGLSWLLRVAFGLLGGAALGLAAWFGVRALRPRWRRWPARAGDRTITRVLVTLLPLALLALAGELVLPGVNGVEFAHVALRGGGTSSAARAQVSVFALGVMPVLTAFAIVELIALAVPRWRRLRHAGAAGRGRLGRAVAALAVGLALIQGYFVAVYLESLALGGAQIVTAPGLRARLLIAASLAGGTMVLVVLAEWIGRRGLGNGYGALLASGWLLELARWLADDRVHRASILLGVAAFGAIALVGFALLRWRVDRLRLPACGVEPLSHAFGLAQLVGTFAALELLAPTDALAGTLAWIASHAALMVVAIAAFAALWSHVFARPTLVRDVAARAGVAPPGRRSWWRATGASAAGVLAIGAIAYATAHPHGSPGTVVDVMGLLFTVAVVLDACEDARARRADLVAVWPLHQVQHAELVGDALHAAGIAAHLQGSHLRALLAFFGPFAPITVYVPRADAEAAEARIRAIVLAGA